jgi:hypothetical protein
VSHLVDTMDTIEQRFEDERELRRLLAAAERDERLAAEERRVAVERCAFYLGDFHARRRAAERIDHGELDVVPLER